MNAWNTYRIKDIAKFISEKANDYSLPYIALDNIVSWDGYYIPSDSTSDGNSNVCNKGDVLFGKLRPYLAKGYIPTQDSICSPEFIVLRPTDLISNKFLLYYLLSCSFVSHIKNQVAGVKMPRTNALQIGGVSFALPPIEEQEQIVSYLDKKCDKITKEIDLLEQKVDCYSRLRRSLINRAVTRGLNPNIPLKPSGNDWIGDIPRQWTIKRNKEFLIERKETIGNDHKLKLLSLTLNGITIRDLDAGGKFPAEFSSYKIVSPNNLVFCLFDVDETPRTVGLSSYVGMITGAYDIFDADTSVVSPKWVYYFYLSVDQKKALKPFYTGLRKVVKSQKFANIHIPIPPIAEQNIIITYLDEVCAKIDRIIEKIESKIERLKALKRSLINEVITGQRAIN